MATLGEKRIRYCAKRLFFDKRIVSWDMIHNDTNYNVVLYHSLTSGKRKLLINGHVLKTYKKVFGGSVDKVYFNELNFIVAIKSRRNPFAEFIYTIEIKDR
jgi:hypothetical protein